MTVTVAQGPLSKVIAATAVSSTSRSKTTFAVSPTVRRTGPKSESNSSRRWQPKSNIGPAARLRPLDEPVACLRAAADEQFERVNLREDGLPDLTGREQRAHARDNRIEVAVIGDSEGDAMRAARGNHPLALAHVQRHRFLAEDVLARLGRGDRLLGMEPHRRGNIDGVDAGIKDESCHRACQRPAPHDVANDSARSARARLIATSWLPGASRSAAATLFLTMSPAPMRPHLRLYLCRFRVHGSGFTVQGSGSEFRVQGSGFNMRRSASLEL